MIQVLSARYKKHIAYLLGFIFYASLIVPAYGMVAVNKAPVTNFVYLNNKKATVKNISEYQSYTKRQVLPILFSNVDKKAKNESIELAAAKIDIDGPGQPEMSSFKPAGTNDMVNLFTGDFSYNIPLLDVGGYPVNIFYNGGISMEQEASWVGLGWNINPGNVNRNMRGVPDDFNGEEKLIQEQNMKKNITWGVSVGADLELEGIKAWNKIFKGSVGASLGYSLNNYLGPSIEVGIRGTTGIRLGIKGAPEKMDIGISGGLNIGLNSRSGMTLTPNLSLSAKSYKQQSTLSTGIGLSTSYNSRSGIKALQLYSQVSIGYEKVRDRNKKSESGNATEEMGSIGTNITSSTISFTKPSYIPAIRSVITNSSRAGRFQTGPGMFGIYPSFEIEGYGQVSSIEPADQKTTKPMVGYLYAENANANRDAVMDFARFNDQEVTPSTSVISVPQYAYDVFSIQGEGTGGSIRAYRNDNGYVRDNFTVSKDKSWSAGGDIGLPGHAGGNFNTVKTPSTIGEWSAGNKLRTATGFTRAEGDKENVYFRNPGENSVLQSNQYDSIGGTELVRYKLGGTNFSPSVEPKLQIINTAGNVSSEIDVQRSIGTAERKKRTQVTSFLTAEEAANIGLDKKIKIYSSDPSHFLEDDNKLKFTAEDRVLDQRKKHHISQINVTEADGKRYVYGIPVYNLKQKDFSFTVANDCDTCDLVPFEENEASIGSTHMNSGVGGKDGYVQVTETPAYAHSFLLSGLLSPDYVDVHGDGITEDDLGGAVKFNYTQTGIHKWRTPLVNSRQANSNPGNLSETRDDKGIVSYGERESWYLQSVESKTMIAFFTLENRSDGKGASGQFALVDYTDNTLKRLKQIDLYNKADLKKNGISGAKPVKTVHFSYNYTLCNGTPDNLSGGKLTLEKIWFTYNGQNKANKNQYIFSYTKDVVAVTGENPSYEFNASDRWGNYKSASDNPGNLKNRDYPYGVQNKSKADQNANAWALKKILLPSGGQLEVEYESDDYAFVQNKRAAVMSGIIGFSNTSGNPTNNLYTVNGSSVTENDYIFIRVSESCNSAAEVLQKYLQGMKQLLVKLNINMPKGPEFLTSYAAIADYGVYSGAGFPAIWVRMQKVQDKNAEYSPLSMTAVEFIRERLPAQAFKAYDVTEGDVFDKLTQMVEGFAEGINTFSDIPGYLREHGKAQTVQLNNSFARLNDPDGFKYGGGQRVKKIMLKDNWQKMVSPGNITGAYTSVYGQEYDYTTKENFNGTERTISSGVASYEPSIGGEENPYQTIVQVANEVPLGPTSYGAIEMPVMDAFFPAPLVGYSKVTVTSIGKKQNPDTLNQKTRSAVGRQVTEFYTAKDFPVYYNNTPLDPASDKQEHINPTLSFWYKYAFDSRALSQGFLVATNDMHGKMRSQSSYAENDPATRINYTENFYRNTGTKGFDDKFDFAYNSLSGEVKPGNMGIDIELMTDTREFSLKSNSFEIQGQADWMLPPPFPLWLPFIWPVTSQSENTYRAVTTTKIINYHAVLDSVVVIDKGSQVSTKNLVYDAETGQVIVNRTSNEFNKPVYSVNYPAYWAYSGMGLAYKNIDAVYSNVNFLDGKIVAGISADEIKKVFESGDELYVINAGSPAGCDPIMGSTASNGLIWALDTVKNSNSLTNIELSFIFIDSAGKPYSRTGVKFRIVRSGKRNMLGAPVASITLMTNPVDAATHKITNVANYVINASAVEYKEKWQTDNDVFKKYKTVQVTNNPSNLIVNGDFSAGNTGFTSQYGYSPGYHTGTGQQLYTVESSVAFWNSSFNDCWGTGKMLLANGSTQVPLAALWQQTVTVDPNTNYTFSMRGQSLEANNPAYFHIIINGVKTGDDFQLDDHVCVWDTYTNRWNSGNNTSATITIVDANISGNGNDFALDDISFIADMSCFLMEVPDCDGYAEKSINPYRKGLLGNFRGYRNMVFYGERNENDATAATDIAKNGFLKNFTPYWNFNSNSNLIPAVENTKWVWNTQATRYNAKGMELETKDALNIYTAAQYGYSKTLPTTIANNSRYDEMAYEGFEDYGYNDLLNGSVYNSCAKKHIDFAGIANSSIVNTDASGINAHSGKYVMAVNSNTTGIKNIAIANNYFSGYNLHYEPGTVKDVYQLGLNLDSSIIYSNPSFGNFYKQTEENNFDNTSTANHIYKYSLRSGAGLINFNGEYYCNSYNSYFKKIETQGVYVFNISYKMNFFNDNGGDAPTDHGGEMKYKLRVLSTDGTLVFDNETTFAIDNAHKNMLQSSQLNVCLPKGIYKIEISLLSVHDVEVRLFDGFYTHLIRNDEAGISIANASNANYSSLATQEGCTYTKPIPAKDSMQNPIFSLPSEKKMLFSAWVRESNTQVSSYTHNEVQIDFGTGNANNVIIKPTGPVIEGWQRYEGYFTAPSNVSEMKLKFVNSSGSAIYFDDIRIHPFNANMKSYVYDPVNLRLRAELDANNYASFYEYDEEGTLIRTKAETREGIKTVTESRSAKQKTITGF